jgi:UDP-glucose 4-epimerase
VRAWDLRPSEFEKNSRDVRKLRDCMEGVHGVSAVIHLAACVSVPACDLDPAGSAETNVGGTRNLLEAIRSEQNRQDSILPMIFASSAAVYGNLAELPAQESTPRAPLGNYGAQKAAAEDLMKIYSSIYGIHGRALRFFNVYGVGQDPSSPYSGVISRFMGVLEKNETLEFHGSGRQTRDFVSVHDVVAGIVCAIEAQWSENHFEVINLGSGVSCSILELAEQMAIVFGSQKKPKLTPARAGDIQDSLADIRLAYERLGWKPHVGLKSGLEELYLSCQV